MWDFLRPEAILLFFLSPDFNEDGMLCPHDLSALLDSLTAGKLSQKSKNDLIEHVNTSY